MGSYCSNETDSDDEVIQIITGEDTELSLNDSASFEERECQREIIREKIGNISLHEITEQEYEGKTMTRNSSMILSKVGSQKSNILKMEFLKSEHKLHTQKSNKLFQYYQRRNSETLNFSSILGANRSQVVKI